VTDHVHSKGVLGEQNGNSVHKSKQDKKSLGKRQPYRHSLNSRTMNKPCKGTKPAKDITRRTVQGLPTT